MNPSRPVIRDARRRYVPVVQIGLWTQESELPKDTFDRVRDRLQPQNGSRTPGPLLFLLFTALYLSLFIQGLVAGRGWSTAPFALLALLSIWVALTRKRHLPPAQHVELARALLAERHCPSCAYSLADTAPDDRGHTICPECGAAWKLAPQPAAAPTYP
jgi:hypothetical protein